MKTQRRSAPQNNMSLIVAPIVLGVIFYFIEMIPMAAPMPQIIRAIVVIVAVVMVLQWLGVGGLPRFF